MLLYTQRIEVARHDMHINEFVQMCEKWGVKHERLKDILKIWFVIEYVQNSDFWRRRIYTDDDKPINGKVITTYAPAYICFSPRRDNDKTLISIIALDDRCFAGAMEFIKLTLEGEFESKHLSFEEFPDDVPIEEIDTLDHSTGREHIVGFAAPLSKGVVLDRVSKEKHRYFSMKIGVEYSLTDSIQLTAIGLEEDEVSLNIVMKESTSEPLSSDNEVEIIEEISKLLDKLYIAPADVCGSRV